MCVCVCVCVCVSLVVKSSIKLFSISKQDFIPLLETTTGVPIHPGISPEMHLVGWEKVPVSVCMHVREDW